MTDLDRLAQIVGLARQPIRNVPFKDIIPILYGHAVTPLDQVTDADVLGAHLNTAMTRLIAELDGKPITSDRPNEAGNGIESHVFHHCKAAGLDVTLPTTASGAQQASGYPDLQIQWNGHRVYLEIKTYDASQAATTFRSFYMSPSATQKINADGAHVLIAFALAQKGKDFRPLRFRISDLGDLLCDLKVELNSSNKKMYLDTPIWLSGEA